MKKMKRASHVGMTGAKSNKKICHKIRDMAELQIIIIPALRNSQIPVSLRAMPMLNNYSISLFNLIHVL